jgi:hypothetical protein
LDVIVNGVTKLCVPFGEIENLTVNGGGGNDTLLLDYTRGECVPGSGITFAGSAGTDVVRIVGVSDADAFHIKAGRITHGTGAVSFTGVDDVVVQHGTFSLDGDLAGVQLEAYGTDTQVVFAASPLHLGAITLSGAAARFAATSGLALSVASLAITGGGTLDLADNALVVDYTATSPADAIRGLLFSGRAGGTWAGTGIVSSTAAADPRRGIGYAEASLLGVTSWGGIAVDATAVVLKCVAAGDTDLNGGVDADDYARTDRGRAAGLGTWVFGDFDYDGVVTAADLAVLDGTAASADAPEPAMAATPPAAPEEVVPVATVVAPTADDQVAHQSPGPAAKQPVPKAKAKPASKPKANAKPKAKQKPKPKVAHHPPVKRTNAARKTHVRATVPAAKHPSPTVPLVFGQIRIR